MLDQLHLPAYSVAETARYLQIPQPTLRSWLGDSSSSLIRPARPGSLPSLSFTNLVELHVLRVLRTQHRIAMHRVRAALDYVSNLPEIQSEHPLAHVNFQTDGVDLFIEKSGLVNASRRGQFAIRAVLEALLTRVQRDEGQLVQLFYPVTRTHNEYDDFRNDPKHVVIDPRISFGRPHLQSCGVPVFVIRSRHQAGEDIRDLAEDYDCGSAEIEEALRMAA